MKPSLPRILTIWECTDCPFCKVLRMPVKNDTDPRTKVLRCNKTGAPAMEGTVPATCPLEPLAPDSWRKHMGGEKPTAYELKEGPFWTGTGVVVKTEE